jgi:Nuclease-related domain
VNALAVEQYQRAWWPAVNGLQWALAIGLLLRLGWLAHRHQPEAETARWAAGATGEDIVAGALEQLESDHVVIHNLPLPGRGDADHVVVGPAGVVVIETKYLSGRIICQAHGDWLQLNRDEVRHIADPSVQVHRAAQVVAARLRSRGLWDVPVRSMLVLAHPRAELDVSRSAVPVVRPIELVPVLRQLARHEAQLGGEMVTAAANALVTGRPRRSGGVWTRPARGQVLVEVACGLSVILVLVFGLLGVARVTGALLGLTAVAREAARVGARAPDAVTAFDWAVARGQQIAADYGLSGVSLDVDTSSFEVLAAPGVLAPGEIRVRADATVDLSDVPLVAWAQLQVPLERRFAEVVDPYRSAPSAQGRGG